MDSCLLHWVRELNESGTSWHHHMAFPACSFNAVPGKWTITVESVGATRCESWDDEPVEVLREFEVLFFDTQDLA